MNFYILCFTCGLLGGLVAGAINRFLEIRMMNQYGELNIFIEKKDEEDGE